jgi:hypothetical protein
MCRDRLNRKQTVDIVAMADSLTQDIKSVIVLLKATELYLQPFFVQHHVIHSFVQGVMATFSAYTNGGQGSSCQTIVLCTRLNVWYVDE